MTKKQEIQNSIQEEVIYINNTEHVTMATEPSGIVHKESLERFKRTCGIEGFKYASSRLVKVKQGYPRMDDVDVEYSIDCVVLSRTVYDNLIKYLENE
jgi:hypothetical protein